MLGEWEELDGKKKRLSIFIQLLFFSLLLSIYFLFYYLYLFSYQKIIILYNIPRHISFNAFYFNVVDVDNHKNK